MANQDPIPSPDSDFNILQNIIVNKCTLNKVAWGITDAELLKLTDKQTIWAAAWLIAQDKQNSTTAQKKAKDLARRQYEKVLRPFIQKWIYRNENMTDDDVLECGLRPRDTTPTEKQKPATPEQAKAARGETGELVYEIKAVDRAEYYGGILVTGQPLPEGITLNSLGQLIVVDQGIDPPDPPAPGLPHIVLAIDFTKGRKKKFTGLKPGTNYHFYSYAGNTAGVSALSAPVIIKCW